MRLDPYTLFRNFKRWLVIHGQPLLDLILTVQDDTTDDPTKRYVDFETEFDKHFNLLSFYMTQRQVLFPAVLLTFSELPTPGCVAKFRVTFDVYFQTIAPEDSCSAIRTIPGTPEAILAWQTRLTDALCELVYNAGDDLRHEEFDGKPWELPINYVVTEDLGGILYGVQSDEVLHFQIDFDLMDTVSTC